VEIKWRSESIYGALLVIIALFSLMGCGGNTIRSTDTTALFSVTKEKALSPRGSAELSYLGTFGSDRSTLTRVDETRFDVPEVVDTSYVIHSLFANYSFKVFNGTRLNVALVPGLNASYYDLNVDNENIIDSRDDGIFSYGLKFEPSIVLNDKLTLVGHYALYVSVEDLSDGVLDAGLSFLYVRETKPNIIAGARLLSIYNNESFPESDVALQSAGLHLGVQF